jgi:hypothetical protein
MPHRIFDHIEMRCPQLGGEVTFRFCRTLSEGLPCPRALVCFESRFPVEQFFRSALREETFRRIFLSTPPGRVEKLLQTVSEAKERVNKDDPDS